MHAGTRYIYSIEVKKMKSVKCPGGKIRSSGKGKGLGHGKGKGPIGIPKK